MSSAESRAKSIILAELGLTHPSYQELLDGGFTGYTHSYLQETVNLIKLTTNAKLNILLELAECDLLGIENFQNKTQTLSNVMDKAFFYTRKGVGNPHFIILLIS